MSSSRLASAASNTNPSASSCLSSSDSLAGGAVVEVDAELLGLHHHAGAAAEVADRAPGCRCRPARARCARRWRRPPCRARRCAARPCGRTPTCRRRGRPSAGGRFTSSATWRLTAVRRSRRPSGRQLDAHLQLEVGDAGHQVGVAGALAVAVDRALELGGAAEHGGDRVGHRAAGVVLGVDAELLVGAEVGVRPRRRCAAPRGAASRRWCRTARGSRRRWWRPPRARAARTRGWPCSRRRSARRRRTPAGPAALQERDATRPPSPRPRRGWCRAPR